MSKKYIFWSIKDLAQISKSRRDNEFDCIICFCGPRGNSKSTGGYKLGLELNFKAERDLVYNREKLIEALEDWERVIDGDEIINSAYKREFYNLDQIELIKLLNMYRDHRHVIIFCIPNFWDLDKPLRDLVKIRIDMKKRGLGEVHAPLNMSYANDTWDQKMNERIERSWIRTGGKVKRKPWKLTTFIGYLKFGKLHPDQEEKYKRLKNEARERLRDKKKAQKEGMKDLKELNFYQHLLKLIKEKKVTKEGLNSVCLANGLKYTSVVSNLNNRLKNEGHNKTLKDFLVKLSQDNQKTHNNSIVVLDNQSSQNKEVTAFKMY